MNDLGPITPSDLSRHRVRTLEVLKPWGMSGLWAHAGTRVPIDKISEASFLAMQKDAELWVKNGLSYNLLGVMPPDMVDLDLDVRVKDAPSTRGPDWSSEDRAGADDMFRTFRQSLQTMPGFDCRSVFGRASLGGNGHALIRVAPTEDIPDDVRRGRIAKLAFAVDLGWFTVKLEVRQSPRKKEGRKTVVLPGSTYPGDYIKFHSLPNGPAGPHNSVLTPFPLEQVAKAIYRTAFLLSLSGMTNEGERHETALLASGVLRREVEFTENEGEGGLNRDEARALFEDLFADDPELKDRRQVFESDFARDGTDGLPGYKRLGERIGEGTANALKHMLHGQATDVLDDMRQNMIFVRGEGSLVIDLSLEADTEAIKLCNYTDARNTHAEKTVQSGRKRIYLFDRLRNSPSRRQTDGVIDIPGVARGQELWLIGGKVGAEPPGKHLINIGAGWRTPHDAIPHPRRAEAARDLKTMLAWLSSKERDHEKIMQMWAFKIQNPMVKPQFAMGVYGGQGIGKNVVLEEFPFRVMGASVKNTSAKTLFGDRFQLQSAIGASFLVVNEANNLTDFQLAKDLHRNERHDIDVKFGEKGAHRLFCIPIYITNESHPEFQVAGEIDRTLYVVKAHTMQSLGCASLQEYEAFKMRRKAECGAMLAKFDPDYCRAFMQILMEYKVTQEELENIEESDSLSDDYRDRGLSPEQLALQKMLMNNCINSQIDARPPLHLPFAKPIFDDGFNYEYLQYAPRGTRPLAPRKINGVLRECLGPEGELGTGRANDTIRVYWFPVKLGTLCDTFTRLTGGDIPRDTKEHMETGSYKPDQPTIRNRIDVFSRVDRGSKSF